MVDSINAANPVSSEVKPINNNVNISKNNNGLKKDVKIEEKTDLVDMAHPSERKDAVDKVQTDIKKTDRGVIEEEKDDGSLSYTRNYSVEENEFILKVYDKQGKLVNKIPPGYLTLKDRDLLNLYA